MSGDEEKFKMDSTLPPNSTADAVRAIHEGDQQLRRVRGLWPRVNSVTGTLTRELEENDFAGRIRRAVGGTS